MVARHILNILGQKRPSKLSNLFGSISTLLRSPITPTPKPPPRPFYYFPDSLASALLFLLLLDAGFTLIGLWFAQSLETFGRRMQVALRRHANDWD